MRLDSHLAFEQLVLEKHSTPSYDSVFRVAPILDYKAFSQVQKETYRAGMKERRAACDSAE
jgi:hypothetical protein